MQDGSMVLEGLVYPSDCYWLPSDILTLPPYIESDPWELLIITHNRFAMDTSISEAHFKNARRSQKTFAAFKSLRCPAKA
jgi:hypothetical protein